MPNEMNIEVNGGGLRIAIVVARFNEFVTSRLLEGAVNTLTRNGVTDNDINTVSYTHLTLPTKA